ARFGVLECLALDRLHFFPGQKHARKIVGSRCGFRGWRRRRTRHNDGALRLRTARREREQSEKENQTQVEVAHGVSHTQIALSSKFKTRRLLCAAHFAAVREPTAPLKSNLSR